MTSCQRLRDRGGWAEDAATKKCSFPIGFHNTISNAAYAVVGGLCALLLRTPDSYAFAVTMLYLAIGSAWYHGTKRWIPNLFDRSGMYAVFTYLALVGFSPDHWKIALGLAILSAALFPKLLNISLGQQIGTSVALAALSASWFGSWKLTIVSLGLFLVAMGFWILDKKKSPLVGIYGHAYGWHVGTAIATGLLFLAQQRGTYVWHGWLP